MTHHRHETHPDANPGIPVDAGQNLVQPAILNAPQGLKRRHFMGTALALDAAALLAACGGGGGGGGGGVNAGSTSGSGSGSGSGSSSGSSSQWQISDSCIASGAGSTSPAPIRCVVSTLAGTGAIGLDNGTGATATFNKPRGVAVDTSGFVYVTDYSNNVIRKISPDGVVSTLAGEGSIGLSNGSGATATFSSPYGLAVDSSGFVYVSDYNNDLIRKISPEGVVSTLAGAGFAGYGNGAGSNARFYGPSGVVLDSSGHLYVSDYLNRLIRKVSNAGVVSTVAGGAAQLTGSADGTGATASFFNPAGIAMDSSGHLYVADSYNHRIRKISPEGVVSTLAGTVACYNNFLEGTGATAKFYFPTGVAVDTSGNVFVADQLNHRIRMITSAGVVSTLAGVGWSGHADGTGATARFNYPYGVAIDNSGNLYVADNTNNQIRKITLLY